MIKNSLEWNKIEDEFRRKSRNLSHNRDISKMIDNIRGEIKELSIAEIDARRGKTRHALELLDKINQDIDMVEEYILVAALLG